MAGKAENMSVEMEQIKLTGKTYEKPWIIPNWDRVQRSEDGMKALTFEFETGTSSGAQTKWLLGFKTFSEGSNSCRLYWKLMEVKGFQGGKVHSIMTCTVLFKDSKCYEPDTQETLCSLGNMIDVPFQFSVNANWTQWINSNGELVLKFKLIIMEPEVPSADLKLETFQKHSAARAHANFARLLGDKGTADLKIVTNDGKELFAHKVILQAQCPVFESMFRADMSENKTGIVNVEDVTAKTMGILLHLFYSGELLPSWKDRDTVVEFTYAAGKYQLTNVLELLDKVVGSRDKEDATHTDVQLLELVRKLDLKIAEKELMNRIRKTVNKIKSGGEFLALWGVGGKE